MNLDRIWEDVLSRNPRGRSSIHGVDHWVRVERNGLYIAGKIGADATVVSLFALFHDSRRKNDGFDPGHGLRGAEYARSLRRELSLLSSAAFETLLFACTHHTDRRRTDDPTVAACWDADRLELGRVGIAPREGFFNTDPGREIVRTGGYHRLERTKTRPLSGGV